MVVSPSLDASSLNPSFCNFFYLLNRIATDITDSYLGMFAFTIRFFQQFFPSFLGQWRNEQPDLVAIILRGDTDIGLHDGSFDGRNIFFPMAVY